MGKTIKEKARIAWERDVRVEVKWRQAWVESGVITSLCPRLVLEIETDTKTVTEYIEYKDVTDIRFVGEPETKEEEKSTEDTFEEEMIERGILLREATVDELGEENEELRARVKELEEDSQERIRKAIYYETRNAELTEQLMALEKTITELEERLTVAEADQEIVMECENAQTEETESTPGEAEEHRTFGIKDDTPTPGRVYANLRHAKRYGYSVKVEWKDRDGKTNYCTGVVADVGQGVVSFRDHVNIEMDCIYSTTVIHLPADGSDEQSDEQEDAVKWTYDETVTGGWWIYEDDSVQEYIGEVKTEQYAKDIVDSHNQAIASVSPDEPEDIANSGDMLSTTQRLEHHLKHNHVVEIDYMCPDRHIESSYIGTIGMAQHDMRFVDGKSIPVDSITGIRVVIDEDAEPTEPEDIAKQRWVAEEEDGGLTIKDSHGNCLIMWAVRASAASEAQIELMAAAPELADMSRAVLECMGRPFDGRAGKANEALRQLLEKLGVMELKHKGDEPLVAQSETKVPPDSPEDMAKQRWHWVEVNGKRRLCVTPETLKRGMVSDTFTKAQKALQAAAPELADRLREFANGSTEYRIECIKLLRELSVPNVAPWYKEGLYDGDEK